MNQCKACGHYFLEGFCLNCSNCKGDCICDDDNPKISDRELDKLIAQSEAAVKNWTPEQRQKYEDDITTDYPGY